MTTVALNSPMYGNGENCGMCVKVLTPYSLLVFFFFFGSRRKVLHALGVLLDKLRPGDYINVQGTISTTKGLY